MSATPEAVHAGQAAFNRLTLSVYDDAVLGLVCRYLWRCPVERVLAHYRKHLSVNHLEAGVGTGFFLDRSGFPALPVRLGLLDLNDNCLRHTAARLARRAPEVYRGNVLEPIRIDTAPFASVGINYVLHCLPGSLGGDKGNALRHLSALLEPGGVLFGSTVLGSGVPCGPLARGFMHLLNRRRVFSNREDGLADLVRALETCLTDVTVETVGCVALFSGRRRHVGEGVR